jgi:hypothetical protein
VALIQKKTPDELARRAAAKEQKRRQAAARQEAERRDKERLAFLKSPAGQARLAFERGDHVFQCSIDVMSQQAVIVAMVGSTTTKKTGDPSVVLNSVCNEGWELATGSFVFVEQGHQSRDKFMSSGQNVAIKGTTVGYYLFKRCEANKGASIAAEGVTFERATQALRNGDLEGGAVMFRDLRDGALAANDQDLVIEVDGFISQLPSTLSEDELAIFETYFQRLDEKTDGRGIG